MEIEDSYKSVAGNSQGLFKDNGSRFIALAYPVETEEAVKEIVAGLRKTTMPGITATHTVSALKGMFGGPPMTENLPEVPEGPFWGR